MSTTKRNTIALPVGVMFGLSGMLGACTSGVLLYPLDTVRTRLQLPWPTKRYKGVVSTFCTIVREESVKGLYRGLPVHVSAVTCWSFLYFGTYNALKHNLPAGPNHPITQAAAAGSAWILSTLVTNPLWIVKTRAQMHPEPFSLKRAYTELMDLRKRNHLMIGVNPAMWGAVTVMIQLPLYEKCKYFLLSNGILSNSSDASLLSVPGYLACSSLSMTVSSFLTYPQDVIRARLQGTDRYNGALDCIRKTIREESFRGLYSGLGAHLTRLLPTSAITFIVYEWMCSWWTRP